MAMVLLMLFLLTVGNLYALCPNANFMVYKKQYLFLSKVCFFVLKSREAVNSLGYQKFLFSPVFQPASYFLRASSYEPG